MLLQSRGLQAGMALPEINREVTQENINQYAAASRDFNPIHLDVAFARQAGLAGTIAHGMLVLAYVSTYMTELFGGDWLTGGGLNIRFKAPARPGDNLKISGNIIGIDEQDSGTVVSCNIFCRNQDGDDVILGDTKVRIKEL